MELHLNKLELIALERILDEFEDSLDSNFHPDEDEKEKGYDDLDMIRKLIWAATTD